MRIVIDMQGAQTESRFRGIGRYTLSLAQAIVRNKGEHEVFLALNGLFPDTIEPIRAAFDSLLPQENIRVWHAPGPVRQLEPWNEWRQGVAERIREAFLASLQPDVVHVSSLFEGYIDDAATSIGTFAPQLPTAVTLYDLIPLINSETYLDPRPDYARFYQRKVEYLRRANQWLAISESAAREGRNALMLPPHAVINISTACDEIFRPLEIEKEKELELRNSLGIYQSFILYSGGADGRKNLKRLIQAYARLPKSLRMKYQLVLVGKMTLQDEIRLRIFIGLAGIGPGRILFAGYISDEKLAYLYNLCTVFVLPSFHEGFGLPALEAMSCGAAVIGANTTSVPEVIGREDALFDPYDESAISQKLAQVLGDAAFRRELASHGVVQAKKFSWDESGRRAIKAFDDTYFNTATNWRSGGTQQIIPDLISAIATNLPLVPEKKLCAIAHALTCIHTDNLPRHLFVDISELAQRDAGTGIQRVTRSILKELLDNPPEGYLVTPVYATTNRTGYCNARSFTARFRGLENNFDDDPIVYKPGDIFLGLDLQHQVVAAQSAYLAALRRDGVKVVFVVYDLLPILMPDFFPPGADRGHKAWLENLMGFDGAVCISRSVADELGEWQKKYGPQRMRPFKISWFHLGADVENSVPSRGLPADTNHVLQALKRRPTFLTVGTVEPRKGQAQVLEAFELLWQRGLDVNFVIVGKQGWMVKSLVAKLKAHPERDNRLFWLEGISDEYLEGIYAISTCLIAASEGEGFGLPLIEAAQKKLPIIAREIPVFKEVAGTHAYFFSGRDPEQLAAAIIAWLDLYNQNQHPASSGMPWHTWKQSAASLLEELGLD